MPTEIIHTIKSKGGDYTSLAAWEAAQQRDLTAVDEIAVAECYNFQDTTAVLIAGWTTDATRYIKVYTPTSERHTGVADTGYRLTVAGVWAMQIREEHVHLEGLETTSSGRIVVVVMNNPDAMPASPYILIKDCLIYNCDSAAGAWHGMFTGPCGATGYPMFVEKMSKASGTFLRCTQDSQEYGSNDEHMVSRVFFNMNIDGKFYYSYADIKQLVGGSYETDPIEVGRPIGFKGSFNYEAFRAEAEKYYRSLVGSNAGAIRITEGTNIRMFNNRFEERMPFEFDISGSDAGW